MMVSTFDGSESAMDFMLSTVVIILFTCGILYTVMEVMFPILEGKKAVLAEEYFKYIVVDDVVNMDEGTFEVYAMSIEGEVQAPLIYSTLLLEVFESYYGT